MPGLALTNISAQLQLERLVKTNIAGSEVELAELNQLIAALVVELHLRVADFNAVDGERGQR